MSRLDINSAKLIIFDLDGTLVEDHLIEVPDASRKVGYRLEPGPQPYTEPVLMPGRLEAIDWWINGGASFAIATNQGGVALGYQSKSEVSERIARSLDHLNWFDRSAFSVHVCLDHPSAEPMPTEEALRRRKPNGGMLLEAVMAHRRHPDECVFVGDRFTDEDAAIDAGIHYYDVREAFDA